MRFLLADPANVSGLESAIREGLVNPTQIVAVIGKTHGNDLVGSTTTPAATSPSRFP
jgi:cyanuric acid amidohydrolase